MSDPLPHQFRAVYGEMLPRQPLRFVLADDPGAGKTIMAGLLIKELILRGDAANVLVVAPGGLVDQWDEEMREKFGLEFEMLTRDKILARGQPVRPRRPLARPPRRARAQQRGHPRQGVRGRLGPRSSSTRRTRCRRRLGQRGQEDQALPDGRGAREAHPQPPADDRDAALGQGGAVPAVHGAARLRPVRGRRPRRHAARSTSPT